MLRLYQPCIPTRSEEAPTGPQWVHEIKHDGYRIIARKIGDRVQLLTKGGHDWAMRYPYILEASRALKVQLQAKARILPMVLDNAGGGLTEHEEAFYRSFAADVNNFLEPIVHERWLAAVAARIAAKTIKAA